MGKFYICVEVKNIFDSVRKPFYKAHEQKADLNNNKKNILLPGKNIMILCWILYTKVLQQTQEHRQRLLWLFFKFCLFACLRETIITYMWNPLY